MGESVGSHTIIQTLDLVPEGWPYVYITVDKGNYFKSYIGSHDGKNRDYQGSGTIIRRIIKKRPSDLVTIPLFWDPDLETVRQAEEGVLRFLDAAKHKSFYNLKNSATGGNCVRGKTDEERREINEKRKKSLALVVAQRPIEVHRDIHRRQRESLMKNIEKSRDKIKVSLSLKTDEQKLDQRRKNLKSRYLKGKIHLIEVFDDKNVSRGIYFGASVIARLFPISQVGVLQNIKSTKLIKQDSLVGWKFVKLPQKTWEEVEQYTKNSIEYAK